MMNQTIFAAEHDLYSALFGLSKHHPIAQKWLMHLPEWLSAIKNKQRYANAPYFESLVNKLPQVQAQSVDLNAANVSAYIDFAPDALTQSTQLLKSLMPWRKGGFYFGNPGRDIHIDTEWRSDLKWDRIIPHISDLTNKRVLDVGGGSGYHGFRMKGAGAKQVFVIDPSCLFYHQFMAVRHFLGKDAVGVHFVPVGLEALPMGALFHTVFCMGVLYHRKSPFECLEQLKAQLLKGGELILETLVVDGDEDTVLVPKDRYAMMNNVYFLPSVAALLLWLEKAGFVQARCVDISVTDINEQRATQWMDYHSLADFLDKDDPQKTIEGYPRPKRAVIIARVA